MGDWRIRVGALLGLTACALGHLLCGPAGALPPHGPVLSDARGPLQELVIHHLASAGELVETTYRDLLAQLPAEVRVRVVCPSRADFDDLRARLGPLAARLEAVIVSHPITPWSRDRWLAFAPAGPDGPAAILAPVEEQAAAVWPGRFGDQRVIHDLQAADPRGVVALRSALAFDGGDFAADERTAFVTPAVLERNLGLSVDSAEELRTRLERRLGLEVVLLPEAPPHHVGMYLMPVGGKTVLVGDPSLAAGLTPPGGWPLPAPDFSAETQARFDAVAATCRAAGYRVVRMPVVPDADGRAWLTPLNSLLDERPGGRTAYTPIYAGAEPLAREAARIWSDLGFTVRPVDCTATYRHGGSLRCLVNVLRRGQASLTRS